MYIAIDFDGTIVDHRFPEVGEPVPGAIAVSYTHLTLPTILLV